MNQGEAEKDAALGSYGDAVDMAAKVPTLAGVVVALAAVTMIWVWRKLRRPRTV
jgi:hypothetical protein